MPEGACPSMPIRDLFSADVTRDIAPVVYFHEQDPAKLMAEVDEYIVTGGFPDGDPRQRRVRDGIHEQFVRLLTALHKAIRDKSDLPASWISGFYGSGKSSFAKLLGLALDGRVLPDGRPLADALLARDQSPRRQELVDAWTALRSGIDPVAVVFDIGAVARDGEHIHAAAVRKIAEHLGYSRSSPLVAETELKLEIDGRWDDFLRACQDALGRPWGEVKDTAMAEDRFSAALHRMDPATYEEPLSWVDSRAGTGGGGLSVDEAIRAIAAMLDHRAPGKTLFLVVDEVSQYVHQNEDRMLKLQSFVSALGARLKGGVWLLATGQQKIDDDAGTTLQKLKDRFPPALRVHLSPTNIRDVVHRRLLHKDPARVGPLKALFTEHRSGLTLNAYGCQDITEEDFLEVYPLLPGHVELLMDITTALRQRSSRLQGDHHAIRGLLQLLGDLFRDRRLADQPVGSLVTLDAIYDVQQSSLDADLQSTLTQVMSQKVVTENALAQRIVKAVALLEQVQERLPTTPELVARCLYDRIGADPNQREVAQLLETLREARCLSYTEQHGYKIQSSAGQEWSRERDELPVPDEQVHELVAERLVVLMGQPDRPRFRGRPFPWELLFTDRFGTDQRLSRGRDETAFTVDFRYLTVRDERRDDIWIPKSGEGALRDRLVWVVGDPGGLATTARELKKSREMVNRYRARFDGLSPEKRRLLMDEQGRQSELEKRFEAAVRTAFMEGALYFRGLRNDPRAFGNSFGEAVKAAAERFLPELYQHYSDVAVSEPEWKQLLERHLDGVSNKFFDTGLGILGLDAGQTIATCSGPVPVRVQQLIEGNSGASGQLIVSHFAKPPFGYPTDVVRACLIGLLRANRIAVQPEGGGGLITSYADPGTKELFSSDRSLRQADYVPARESEVTQSDLVRIRRLFQKSLGIDINPDREIIADTAFKEFRRQGDHLRDVARLFERLPGRPPLPPVLEDLGKALETCIARRHVDEVVKAIKRNLDRLRDGLEQLGITRAELTDAAVEAVEALAICRDVHIAQLREAALLDGDEAADAAAVEAQLAQDRPWRAPAEAQAAAGRLKDAYGRARNALMARQETEAEAARAAVKRRDGFARLTPDQSNHVLRPITEAVFATDATAVHPTLVALKGQFPERLRQARADANARLDEILERLDQVPVKPVRLPVHGREIRTRGELTTLLRDIEDQIGPLVDQGVRVRVE